MKIAGIEFPRSLLTALHEERLLSSQALVCLGENQRVPAFRELALAITRGTGETLRSGETEDQFLGRLQHRGLWAGNISSSAHLHKSSGQALRTLGRFALPTIWQCCPSTNIDLAAAAAIRLHHSCDSSTDSVVPVAEVGNSTEARSSISCLVRSSSSAKSFSSGRVMRYSAAITLLGSPSRA